MTLHSPRDASTESKTKSKYLHGFSQEEQSRLLAQTDFLAPRIFQAGPLPQPGQRVVELGCGVGAQTRHLCALDPTLQIVGVDQSPTQLEAARTVLSEHLAGGRVSLLCADAENTGLESESFDLAYLCWILEHVQEPQKVTEEAFRLLKPGGTIWVTEVFNTSLHISPVKTAIVNYWEAFNCLQRELHGNPDIGLHLPKLLYHSGFTEIEAQPVVFFYSANNPKERADMLTYWENLMLSALPALETYKKGEKSIPTEEQLKQAFSQLQNNDDTVFFYHPIRCVGRKPAE